MRVLSLLLVLGVLAAPAQAQRGGSDEPSIWLSASAGYLWLATVPDGATQSDWRFGDGFPWRLSVEKSLGGASLGLAAMWMRAPLRYVSPASCGSCDAHATVAYYGPVFRLASNRSWHTILELGAGVMQYGSFTEDATGARLPPTSGNRDFALSFGWGVGYAFSRDWALEIVWTSISTFHERDNLPGNVTTHREHRQARVGLRIGY
ncbi:MAG TPA: outer membrane beta-barrel protein [Gemmatimonadaceae bacterium]